MLTPEDLLQRIMDRVTEQTVESVKSAVAQAVEQEVAKGLAKALTESEFYRQMTSDMFAGLRDVYQEVANASGGNGHDADGAKRLLAETSKRLDEVLLETERAAEDIMDRVERQMERQARTQQLLAGLRDKLPADPAVGELIAADRSLGDDLMAMMTALSFQDLTGQRIKRIIDAIKRIETIVFDLYLSSGLMLKAREDAPEKDVQSLKAEAAKTVSELKGPQLEGASQTDVDSLLAGLGL